MRMCVAGLATAAALGLAGIASAQASAASTSVVPLSLAEGSFAGLPPGGEGGFQYVDSGLAEVGDVNGDGLADVAIGAASADQLGRRDAGVVHVVFGGSSLGRIDLGSPELAGFRITGPRQGRRRPAPAFQPDGPPSGAMAGSAVAGAGDVNGDGLDDILVGAPYAGNRGRPYSGSAFVVFGKGSGEPVDLARLGAAGYRIDGPHRDAAAGYALAGTGDVSGDGRADVVVSAGPVHRPTVYVVLGQETTSAIDLGRVAGRGYTIVGGRRRLLDTGAAVSGAGDFNGDGLADIAVGAPQSGLRSREGAGATFVVFGRPGSGSVSLGELAGRGVRIDGEHEFSNLGEALARLGDVNGDGRDDLLVGASQVSAPGRSYSGAAYVVFGRPGPGRLDLRRVRGGAYRILGPGRDGAAGGTRQGRAGISVAALGDVNGDGRRDMVSETGQADAVLVEVRARALGVDLPLAAGYATVSQPETRTVRLVAPRHIRRLLRRRSRLRTRVVVSQCTTAGYEHTARTRIVFRRR